MPHLYQTFKAVILAVFLVSFAAVAQEQEYTTDELYTQARNAAFEEDDYPKAIALLKAALKKSPDYLEVRVFLGRIYTYSDSLPQARMAFEEVLAKEKGHEEASFAYGNLEFWNDNSEAALKVVNKGLDYHPESENLGLLKAKVLRDLEAYEEATATLQGLLEQNPKLDQARSLLSSINSATAKNAVGLNYEFVYFDERFDDPWHLAALDYIRQTKLGSVAARINFANRFRTDALQFEVDAYPRISDVFYTYVNLGISSDSGIFPQYRAGFSLFSNLPASFEADAGFRYLAFDDDTFVYTLGLGKYYKNYWFNFRTYLTPSDSALSQSYALTVRYYFGGADDFIGARIGTGISPDDNANSALFNGATITRLRSNNLTLFYRKLLGATHVLTAQAGLEDQEYAADSSGLQFSVSVGFIKRF
ncbi:MULTISPECIES: YaiO family outer membrane beta-barrel protein [Leeuwenhoekiella]|uniref:YaiO family outer membrane beta-barrel protein n=1 Tax=Leeuwenhoekiella TaxID=283735 RepID=UPI000ECDC06C|nr:YaiO family outer membrane beta-barrel protein [Leeuwenhoekiella blandensis]HCW64788.1 hypothetical protein [Leeuwenhoekiella sp.]|tara:strand:- start:16155 stop:17414 length:1260 start_codon:yes stop_codon:yes gene_type:complete